MGLLKNSVSKQWISSIQKDIASSAKYIFVLQSLYPLAGHTLLPPESGSQERPLGLFSVLQQV